MVLGELRSNFKNLPKVLVVLRHQLPVFHSAARAEYKKRKKKRGGGGIEMYM